MKPMDEISLVRAAIILTQASARQLHVMTKRHGGPSKPFVQTELAWYLLCHERAGCTFDPDGKVLRFDDQIIVLVKKTDGVWHILRVWWRDAGERCRPVYLWQVVKQGWREVIAHVLVGWRYTTRGKGGGYQCA